MNGLADTMSSLCWRFGPDWPGKRCSAKTRAGTPCQKPALSGKTRCQLHGGRGGAPSGQRNGNYRTGQFTKEARQAKSDAVARIRTLINLGQAIGMFR